MTQSTSGPIIIEQIYNAPLTHVWNAITALDKMNSWYFDLSDFKPEPGFEFHFYGEGRKGERYLHKCRITEVIPEKKLSYTWSYDGLQGNSDVSFELFPEGNKTRLRLTHAGVETFPSDRPDFARDSFVEGWTYITGTALKQFVEKIPA